MEESKSTTQYACFTISLKLIKSTTLQNKIFNFYLFKGDLLSQDTDIIVNAANNTLHLGGGVAGAILRNAGYSVQIECDQIMSKFKSSLRNGDVQVTGVGKLKGNNLKKIFHDTSTVKKTNAKI